MGQSVRVTAHVLLRIVAPVNRYPRTLRPLNNMPHEADNRVACAFSRRGEVEQRRDEVSDSSCSALGAVAERRAWRLA